MALFNAAKKKTGVMPQQVKTPVINKINPVGANINPIKQPINSINPVGNSIQNTGTVPTPTPYVDPFLAENEKLRNAIKAPTNNYDFNTDPAFQALKATYEKQGQTAYENTLGSKGDTINTAIASAASQAKQGYNENLMALVPGMQQNNYNQQQDTYNTSVQDYNRGLDRSALAYTQSRNTVTDANTMQDRQIAAEALSYNKGRTAIADSYVSQDRQMANTDREHKQYQDSITGLGDQFDYSGAIKENQNDGNPNNDWQIPMLQKEKINKIAAEAANVGQYSNDYQARINQLQPNDPRLPALYAAQDMKRKAIAEKARIEAVNAAAAKEKSNQFNSELSEKIRSNKAGESINQQQVNISQQNANTARDSSVNKTDAKDTNKISLAYSDMLTKGKDIEEWLKTPTPDGSTNGAKLTDSEIKDLIALTKKQSNGVDPVTQAIIDKLGSPK